MNIPEHRKAIDKLDAHIVQLLNERTQHVLEIGNIKLKAGEEIYAPHREQAVLDRICKMNAGPITNESLRAIYREIMSSALSLEKSMTISFLGPETTFTHQAAIHKFGASLKYSAQKTIADVFKEVSRRKADYGVVPVENSTEGVVTHTLDMFVESDLKIVAQIVLRISHCFVSKHPREKIKRIFVHPQTLGQCRNWLQLNFPNASLVETLSNAESAMFAKDEPSVGRTIPGKKKVSKKGLVTDERITVFEQMPSGAITTALAAAKYELSIVEQDIQDNSANATRFIVLGRQCSPPTGKDRTSLMLSLAHEVGALHGALAAFRKYKLNMTKIESRPSKRKAWEYFFFVDCDGHQDDKQVAKAIADLEKSCNFVKILGSYPNAE